jgi:hypothetical protein
MTADAVMLPVWRDMNWKPRALLDLPLYKALSFTENFMADHRNRDQSVNFSSFL